MKKKKIQQFFFWNIFYVFEKVISKTYFIYGYFGKLISKCILWVSKNYFQKFHYGKFISEHILCFGNFASKIISVNFKKLVLRDEPSL